MGGDDSTKPDNKRRVSTDKSIDTPKPKEDKKRTQQKQTNDYSKLEGGERPRISPEDLGELIAEADTEKLEKYGGVKGVAGALNTDLERGLSESDIEDRKKTYGENRPPEKPQRSYFHFVWDAFQDKTLIILAVCAGVSIALGVTVEENKSTGWIDGVAILAAVCIVVLVTATNDYSKDKKFRTLSQIRDEQQITVVREGEQKSISIFDVLVGDVVELEAGAPIPADGLYISGQNVTSDESPMTGESDSVRKDEEDPFMLSGCTILEGVCQMLVIAVGEHSQKGKISALLDTPNEDTPLTKKLEHLANQIGKFGLIAAVLTLVILLVKYVINFRQEHKTWAWSELGVLVKYLISAITIVVVAVPEGLPLAVTISLAYSMMKMMKDQNLVRHLEACETMGGATNICSDKTGTLTENRMTVSKIYLCGEEIGEENSAKELDEKVARLFTEGIAINSNAYIVKKKDQKGKGKDGKDSKDGKGGKQEEEHEEKTSKKDKLLHRHKHDKEKDALAEAKEKAKDDDRPEFVGSKTECALLLYLTQEMDVNYDEIRKNNKKNIVKLYPFSSERKMMSTAMKTDDDEASHILYCKGASEMILEQCTKIRTMEGEEDLDDEERERLEDMIEEYASSGLRTIGLAYREFSDEPDWEDDEDVIQDLTFLGIAGIMDPVRKEVPDAVEKCKKAGIMVRMITGDNLLTAKHIAKECGILTEDGIAIEGPKFRKMSEAELDEILPKLQVIARAAPTDKYTLVHRLRELGEVVAVTGDGVNDAPQLKEADVGFAMGITGTEVAKDASDIVLLDDNFSSIVKAVMWGRNVYDSIRKFIQFQLTVNLVAVAVAFIGSVTDGESPLTPVQLLWVNLIMDTFAALALATERPTEDLLDRKPYGRYDKLITRTMWRNIISQAVFQLGVLLLMLYAVDLIPFVSLPPKSDTENYALARNTLLFNTFVMCQLFNEINSRKLGNELNVFSRFFSNPVFLGVLAITLVGQFLLVQFAGAFASTRPLSINQWIVSVSIGAMSLPIGLAMRGLVRIKDKKTTPEDIKKAQEKEHEKDEKQAKKQAKKDKKKGKDVDDKEADKPKDFGEIGKQIGAKKKKSEKTGDKKTDDKRTDKSEKASKPEREQTRTKKEKDNKKDDTGKKDTVKKESDEDKKDGSVKKERTTKKEKNDDDKKERVTKKEKHEEDSDGETKKKTKVVTEHGGEEKVKKTKEVKKTKDSEGEEEGKEKKEKKRTTKKENDEESSSDEEIETDKKDKKEPKQRKEKKETKEKKEKKEKEEDEDEEEKDGEEPKDFWGRERQLEKGEEKKPEFWSHERDLEAGMTEEEKRRLEKGKAPVRGGLSERDFRDTYRSQEDRRKSTSFSERSSLLPKRQEERDLWGTAANVVTQVSVINALRNQRRRSTVVSYPTTKSNQVTLAKHRRRMSRTNLMLKRSGNING